MPQSLPRHPLRRTARQCGSAILPDDRQPRVRAHRLRRGAAEGTAAPAAPARRLQAAGPDPRRSAGRPAGRQAGPSRRVTGRCGGWRCRRVCATRFASSEASRRSRPDQLCPRTLGRSDRPSRRPGNPGVAVTAPHGESSSLERHEPLWRIVRIGETRPVRAAGRSAVPCDRTPRSRAAMRHGVSHRPSRHVQPRLRCAAVRHYAAPCAAMRSEASLRNRRHGADPDPNSSLRRRTTGCAKVAPGLPQGRRSGGANAATSSPRSGGAASRGTAIHATNGPRYRQQRGEAGPGVQRQPPDQSGTGGLVLGDLHQHTALPVGKPLKTASCDRQSAHR